MHADAALPVLPRPTGAERRSGGATPAPRPSNRSKGLKSAPAELLCFVRSESPSVAARKLGVSRRTVNRIAAGYWPSNDAELLRAWAVCEGVAAGRKTRWFLRKVHPGGLVRHSPLVYTGHGLDARVGELVAVARTEGGGLVAQTLEQPVVRLQLVVQLAASITDAEVAA